MVAPGPALRTARRPLHSPVSDGRVGGQGARKMRRSSSCHQTLTKAVPDHQATSVPARAAEHHTKTPPPERPCHFETPAAGHECVRMLLRSPALMRRPLFGSLGLADTAIFSLVNVVLLFGRSRSLIATANSSVFTTDQRNAGNLPTLHQYQGPRDQNQVFDGLARPSCSPMGAGAAASPADRRPAPCRRYLTSEPAVAGAPARRGREAHCRRRDQSRLLQRELGGDRAASPSSRSRSDAVAESWGGAPTSPAPCSPATPVSIFKMQYTMYIHFTS